MAHLTTKPSAVKPGEAKHEIQMMAEGLSQHFSPAITLMINGTRMTVASLQAACQDDLELHRAADAAKQAYTDAVNTRDANAVSARTRYKALKHAVKLYLGPQSPKLASFGIPMDKARKTDTKTLVVAQGKSQQTREVRGTKGKKQRLALKVVGDPSVTFTGEGKLQVGPRPVNVPPSSGGDASVLGRLPPADVAKGSPAVPAASTPATADGSAPPSGVAGSGGKPGTGSTPAPA